ncbi:MAG: hypothetical protein A2W93_10950 [Bacteroidetes bacterium GWF2_43_63]|nr:MAG: hypothetical protein A2W94_00195 [Bacteroidetes bacterium GWE2_42_42]OFY56432.1 MAG: hypothetical protein A2W93_10950 [Bacteroidetes bacterium GWF2_43_63]HBG72004.1 hypothetical protein [Bacteroidales bacterium]HCB63042.1 hypothetical protein [Bacteroidales bacterium]HCY23260.1 hypothetical protein [Bacteroidales bacterium]
MKFVIAFVILVFSYSVTFADSPLTSTQFYKAYEGSPKVQEALKCNGVLSEDLMKFLNSKKNSIALKMAVINAIGWNFDGLDNYTSYNNFLGKKKGKGSLKADNLLCLAYLKAMGGYFDCADALRMADEALALNPQSYTFNIIHGLIKAQVLFDVSWCELWNATDIVRNNTSLNRDMNAEAIRIIFEYMDLYENECE